MSTRRGRDEGSIYRRKDGRWVAQYTTGDKRRYIYGKTRQDVAAKLSKPIADRDEGICYLPGEVCSKPWATSPTHTQTPPTRTYGRCC